MNQITARISDIVMHENINVVSFEVGTLTMQMMSLELSEKHQKGVDVTLGAKATNIALMRELSETVSISNQIPVTITAINKGVVLCSVLFTFNGVTWESVITRSSAERMQLEVGARVVALIKSSELSILEAR